MLMEAGRELDALVAEKIFGYALDYEFAEMYGGPTVNELRDRYDEIGLLPNYSTDIAAAWQVVEKLAELGMLTSVCWGRSGNHGIIASVDILEAGFNKPIAAHTAPLAICLASLRAVGVEVS